MFSLVRQSETLVRCTDRNKARSTAILQREKRHPGRRFEGGYAKFRSRSHDAVIRVYDAVGNVARARWRFQIAFGALLPVVSRSSDALDAYGTVILRISPNSAGGGPKPTLET